MAIIIYCVFITWFLGVIIYKANKFSAALQQEYKEMKPYKWGYYVGFGTLVSAAIEFIQASLALFTQPLTGFTGILSALLIFWFGRAIFERKKWGWIIYIIISFLYLVIFYITDTIQAPEVIRDTFLLILLGHFIFNCVYAQNRWHEFSLSAIVIKDEENV